MKHAILSISCILLTCISLLISGCSNEKQMKTCQLVATDSHIAIPIDSSTDIHTFCMRYYEDSIVGRILSIENNGRRGTKPAIMMYDIDNKKLVNVIELGTQREIPITRNDGHYIFNPDYITIASNSKPIMFVVNWKGDVVDIFDFQKDCMFSPNTVTNLYFDTNKEPIFLDGKLFCQQFIPSSRFIGDSSGNNFEFEDTPLMVEIDTTSRVVTKSKATYPVLYTKNNNNYHLTDYSVIHNGRNFVLSFQGLDDIFTSSDMTTLTKHNTKSAYIDHINNEGTPLNMDREKKSTIYHNRPKYYSLFYDKYRKVIYRICLLEDNRTTVTQDYRYCHGPFSIQIIDENYNVIGETVFPAKQYVTTWMFVNEDGLWISENNFEREDYSDDILKFRLFSLKKN